jgi:hypothetical protein
VKQNARSRVYLLKGRWVAALERSIVTPATRIVLFFALVMPLVGVLGLRLPSISQSLHLGSGTCFEIHQGTLTPGDPITVCT